MTPPRLPRYNVLGVGVSALTLAQARDLIIGARGSGGPPAYVCLCTVNGLAEARRDPAFRRIFNDSWLTTPDGMPVVWLGPAGVERVYGPDLMLAVCDAGRARGLRHFFYGGKPGVAQELAERLGARFPGLAVAGTHTPPFRELTGAELDALRAEVARASPDVGWSRFISTLIVVDLPAPFGPSSAVTLPSGTARSSPCTASIFQNRRVRLCVSMMFMGKIVSKHPCAPPRPARADRQLLVDTKASRPPVDGPRM